MYIGSVACLYRISSNFLCFLHDIFYVSFLKGSATGASCKDEAGDKQRKKDDHGDGGSNDGDNSPKESNKAEPAGTQSNMSNFYIYFWLCSNLC